MRARIVSWCKLSPLGCSKESGSRNAPIFGDLLSQRHGSAEVHESELRRTGQTGFGRPGRPGNATGSHPETTQPDLHPSSPLPSTEAVGGPDETGGTDFSTGNNSVQPTAAPAVSPRLAASLTSSSTEGLHGVRFREPLEDQGLLAEFDGVLREGS